MESLPSLPGDIHFVEDSSYERFKCQWSWNPCVHLGMIEHPLLDPFFGQWWLRSELLVNVQRMKALLL